MLIGTSFAAATSNQKNGDNVMKIIKPMVDASFLLLLIIIFLLLGSSRRR